MNILALVDRVDHVCCRYRLLAYQTYFQQAGHTLEWLPRCEGWWSKPGLNRIRHADAVVLQRRLLPRWLFFMLRSMVRHLIYDFDDAVYVRDSYSSKGLHSRRRQARFRAVVRRADTVIAGNTILADQAKGCGVPASRLHVIPTCIDVDRYKAAKPLQPKLTPQLVWIGSSSTMRGLELLRPTLETLGRQVPELTLKQISNRFFQVPHLPVVPRTWNADTEAEELVSSDIGISWLPDDAWSRGKCGLKLLQYMAAGLPVVANPVGVQKELVRHGETGFLVSSTDEWRQAVKQLADDESLRRRMGQAGQQLVETGYSVAAGAERWLTLLDRLHRQQAA